MKRQEQPLRRQWVAAALISALGGTVWVGRRILARRCQQRRRGFARRRAPDRVVVIQGGEGPTCWAAWDTNDDSSINITDGIFVLNNLYLGGPSVPSPAPRAG